MALFFLCSFLGRGFSLNLLFSSSARLVSSLLFFFLFALLFSPLKGWSWLPFCLQAFFVAGGGEGGRCLQAKRCLCPKGFANFTTKVNDVLLDTAIGQGRKKAARI